LRREDDVEDALKHRRVNKRKLCNSGNVKETHKKKKKPKINIDYGENISLKKLC